MSTIDPDISKFVIDDNAGYVFIVEHRHKHKRVYMVHSPMIENYVMAIESYDACIRVLYLSPDVPKSGPFA